VADAAAEMTRLVTLGATVVEPLQEVGQGIKTATVSDPFGNTFGVIENPHFKKDAVE
jgi:predicted enzyme related to lactoylglutathione lyase